jgi:hypothetical protein
VAPKAVEADGDPDADEFELSVTPDQQTVSGFLQHDHEALELGNRNSTREANAIRHALPQNVF